MHYEEETDDAKLLDTNKGDGDSVGSSKTVTQVAEIRRKEKGKGKAVTPTSAREIELTDAVSFLHTRGPAREPEQQSPAAGAVLQPLAKKNGGYHQVDDDYDEDAATATTAATAHRWTISSVLSLSFVHWLSAAIVVWMKDMRYQYTQYLTFSFREIKKRKVSYALGVLSCFIAVVMVVLAVTALSKVPLVFLKLAEQQSGEYDISMYSNRDIKAAPTTLNFTAIEQSLNFIKQDPEGDSVAAEALASPRMQFIGRQAFHENTCAGVNVMDKTWMYSGCRDTTAPQFCVPVNCTLPQRADIILIDTQREKTMGFGRDWNMTKLNKGEVYIHYTLAELLGAVVGDRIVLSFGSVARDIPGVFYDAGIYNNTMRSFTSSVATTVTVKAVLYSNMGKSGKFVENLVWMEFEHVLALMQDFRPPYWDTTGSKSLREVSPYAYAVNVYFNMPSTIRYDSYMTTNFIDIQNTVTEFAAGIMYVLGYDQLQTSFPILEFMNSTKYFSLFLSLIISMIVLILAMLSVMLIYSLLMINVETKVFEVGLLRMIGMTKVRLIQLILVQAFCFAIPAWLVALVAGQLIYSAVSIGMAAILEIALPPVITVESVVWGTLLGLVIPIVAALLPIRVALEQNLHESLDVTRSKTKAVKYNISRAEGFTVDWVVVIVGIGMFAFGFGTYYMFPLALLTLNISLLLYMFFGLLMAMLCGLVVLSLNVEHLLETAVSYLFFFWENQAVRLMVLKNLIAHRQRNRKTTIMFALSLAFIIFISVSFDLQIKTFEYREVQKYGSALNIFFSNDMPYRPTFEKLETYIESRQDILGKYAYITYASVDSTKWQMTYMQNIGTYKWAWQYLHAISPGFFDATVPELTQIAQSRDSQLGLGEQLYTVEGSSSMIMSSSYMERFSLSIQQNDTYAEYHDKKAVGLLTFGHYGAGAALPQLRYSLLKPLAFLNAGPIGVFSPYNSGTTSRFGAAFDGYVSLPSYLRMSNGTWNSVSQIPIYMCILQVKDGTTQANIDILKSHMRREIGLNVHDVGESLRNWKIAVTAMDFFFMFSTIIAMFICFFSLMASMMTNIYEQAKEIGVVEAIGARKVMIRRVFVYEAFILVFVASVLGCVIGILVASTMTAQQALFTGLPIPFAMPWNLLIVVVCCSVFFSVVSSLGPVINLTNQPIVSLLRRFVS